jgi:hypothetical protein
VSCEPAWRVDNAQSAPSSDGVCRIWCRPGFHTIERATLLALLDDAAPQDPTRVLCEPCVQRPNVPCPLPPPNNCQLERLQQQCDDGNYACGDLCVRCPTRLGPLQLWTRDCDVICVPNAYMSLDGTRCIPCASLPVPSHAPYTGYRALWNATPGARWWPRAYDPPHLRPRSSAQTQEEPRAGLCWPCSTLVRAGLWDISEPCTTLPSPWRARALPPSPDDGDSVLSMPRQRRLLAQAYTLDRRMLRWSSLSNISFYRSAPKAHVLCPPGMYADAGARCVRCPRGTEGAADGSCRLLTAPAASNKKRRCVRGAKPRTFEPELCACRVGTYLFNNSACRRCPIDTVSLTASNAPCFSRHHPNYAEAPAASVNATSYADTDP